MTDVTERLRTPLGPCPSLQGLRLGLRGVRVVGVRGLRLLDVRLVGCRVLLRRVVDWRVVSLGRGQAEIGAVEQCSVDCSAPWICCTVGRLVSWLGDVRYRSVEFSLLFRQIMLV